MTHETKPVHVRYLLFILNHGAFKKKKNHKAYRDASLSMDFFWDSWFKVWYWITKEVFVCNTTSDTSCIAILSYGSIKSFKVILQSFILTHETRNGPKVTAASPYNGQ